MSEASSIVVPSRLGLLFRSLRHRNYRLFFVGQAFSVIGNWMQFVAVGWLIWTLTGEPFWLGFVPFIGRLPTLVAAPFVGVLIDRIDRHKLVIAAQTAAMVQALILGGLMLAGMINMWNLIALQLMLGLVSAVEIPARQAFVIQMIDRREDLNNAIALNSSMVNSARLVGPMIASLIIAWVGKLGGGRPGFGEGVCVLLNGISYIGVIVGLLAMRVTPNERAPAASHPWHNMVEGARYVFGFGPMRAILLLLALVSLAGQSYVNLLPAFATDVLDGGVKVQGYLMSAAGVGALVGALYLAMRTTVRGLGRVIAAAPVVMGVGLIGLGLSSRLLLSLAIMPIIGVGMMIQTASSNTVLQTIADDDKRGRVMSFYSLAFMGMVPLGSLLSGWAASIIGVQWTVIIGGALCIAGAFAFARKLPAIRALVRPIYVRKGIIPEVATGLRDASDEPAIPPVSPRNG